MFYCAYLYNGTKFIIMMYRLGKHMIWTNVFGNFSKVFTQNNTSYTAQIKNTIVKQVILQPETGNKIVFPLKSVNMPSAIQEADGILLQLGHTDGSSIPVIISDPSHYYDSTNHYDSGIYD